MKLYAFNASSGEIKWVYDAGDMLTTPLYVNGTVITSNSIGEILVIKDGKLLWKKQLSLRSGVNSNSYIAASK